MNEKEGKKHVLIIDDDPEVLSMITRYLRHAGYGVITACDGIEGLRRLDEGGYDLVITDIVIPYVSGVGVVSVLKKNRPEIPVIAITGYGKEPESAAIEKDADMVLSKPVKMARLREHVEQLLSSGKTP